MNRVIFSQSDPKLQASGRHAAARKLKDSASKTNTEYFYILFLLNKTFPGKWSGLAGGNLNNLTGIKRKNISFGPSWTAPDYTHYVALHLYFGVL